MSRAVVLVEVEGGIAYPKTVRGNPEVVVIDWDVLKDCGTPEDFAEVREQIEALPSGPERDRVLSELERIAGGEVYRWAHLGRPLVQP